LIKLLQKREVVVPTLWGWIALLVAGAVAVLFAALNLHAFLAVDQPVGAKLLVVEGWIEPQGLDQAIAAFRSGRYERVVTTGGPIDRWPPSGHHTYADLAADYLRRHGLADASVTAVPAPGSSVERTYLSAVMVRAWAGRAGLVLEQLDVFSSGTHARRSRLLYRLAFGGKVRIGVYAARSTDYDGREWWRTSVGVRDVLDQAVGLLWVKCFFWPSRPGPDAN